MVLSTMSINEIGVAPRGGKPGVNVTVPGSGFGSSTGRVRFDPLGENADAVIVSWVPNLIVFTVPTLLTLNRNVTVEIQTADGNDAISMPFWCALASSLPAIDYQWPNAEAGTPNENVDDPRQFTARDYNQVIDIVKGAVTAAVPPGRNVLTTTPLIGGGDLTADRTIGMPDQAAHAALLGPASGPAAQPAFRAIVPTDIPTLDYVPASTPIAAGRVLAGPATGSAAPAAYRTLVPADIPALDTSFLADGAELVRRDGSVPFTGPANLGGEQAKNLANGTDPQDAVTFAQLDAALTGQAHTDLFFPVVDGQTVFQLTLTPRLRSSIRFFPTQVGYTEADGFFTYDPNTNQITWLNQGFTISDDDQPRAEYQV